MTGTRNDTLRGLAIVAGFMLIAAVLDTLPGTDMLLLLAGAALVGLGLAGAR